MRLERKLDRLFKRICLECQHCLEITIKNTWNECTNPRVQTHLAVAMDEIIKRGKMQPKNCVFGLEKHCETWVKPGFVIYVNMPRCLEYQNCRNIDTSLAGG